MVIVIMHVAIRDSQLQATVAMILWCYYSFVLRISDVKNNLIISIITILSSPVPQAHLTIMLPYQ